MPGFIIFFTYAGVQIKRDLLDCVSGTAFDPLGQARGPAPPLEARNEDRYVHPRANALLLRIFILIFQLHNSEVF